MNFLKRRISIDQYSIYSWADDTEMSVTTELDDPWSICDSGWEVSRSWSESNTYTWTFDS